MKREILLHKSILSVIFGFLVICILYLLFIWIYGLNHVFTHMESTSFNMIAFLIICLMMFFIAFLPAVLISEDNKYIYFNIPKTRMEILWNRYVTNIAFFSIGIAILFSVTYLVDMVYSKIGLVEHETYEIFMAFLSNPLVVLLILFAYFKIIFTLYYFKELILWNSKRIIFSVLATIIFFYTMVIFPYILIDGGSINPLLLISNILMILLSLIFDRYIFLKGEI